MSPIAHAGIGLLAWQVADRKKTAGTLALFILAANLADIDFLLSFVFGGGPLFLHQYYTHNVVFVLAGCGMLALLLGDWPSSWGLIVAGLSHLPLDIIVVDTVPPIGIRVFYPFSRALVNIGVFPYLRRGPWSVLLSPRNLLVLALEFALFVLPVVWIHRRALEDRVRSRAFWRI